MKELFKPEDIERKVILILKILHESEVPLGARVIARRMSERNVQLSERTVRYHLENHGRAWPNPTGGQAGWQSDYRAGPQ